tara:strand:+ start:209 stop:754 length:546 start_codon:yes stop_codon:yes gene_type:complete
MASGAQSAIWRAGTTTGAGTEPATTGGTEDIIEFNSGAVVNNNGVIINTKFSMTSAVAVNEMPSSIDKLQDTGVNGIMVFITGSIEDPKTGGLDQAQKFKTWMLEDKTINETNKVFPKGRFGLRLNDFNALNLTPTADRGYILSDVEFTRNGETKGKLEFIATLRFNGTIGTANGSGQYVW